MTRASTAHYAHQVCACRSLRLLPRLVIPKGSLLTPSNSDSSSSCLQTKAMPHADSLNAATNVQRAASPIAATINSPQISQMQQLFMERANKRRKSAGAAAAAALQKPCSGGDRLVISDLSSASSPVLGSPLTAVAPYSNMQQQLMERAMVRRRMQATSASTEGVLSVDGAQPLQSFLLCGACMQGT
ncbi:hypothetical protein L7F22_063239 [Adiantum nelumboides]|nr:hypothetical protein [Adiantum nelumboides]